MAAAGAAGTLAPLAPEDTGAAEDAPGADVAGGSGDGASAAACCFRFFLGDEVAAAAGAVASASVGACWLLGAAPDGEDDASTCFGCDMAAAVATCAETAADLAETTAMAAERAA